MARSLAALLGVLDFSPKMVIGHSAGAAILARLCLDGTISPKLFVSLNGAFLPFGGLGRVLFPSMAKLLFLNPLAPRLFAWSADKAAVANLLKGTGSKIGPRGVDLYARLLHNPGHVAGALGMMANWDLTDLRRDLPGLKRKSSPDCRGERQGRSAPRRRRRRRRNPRRDRRNDPPSRPPRARGTARRGLPDHHAPRGRGGPDRG